MIEQILSLIVTERDKIDRALEALGGAPPRRGRPPKSPVPSPINALVSALPKPVVSEPRKRRPFSAATRRRMALAQRARWVKVRDAAA